MTVVSMCLISSARVVRRPTFGFAACTRSRGRRQPIFRTRWYQVEGEVQTLPSRCARTASVGNHWAELYALSGLSVSSLVGAGNLGWRGRLRRQPLASPLEYRLERRP